MELPIVPIWCAYMMAPAFILLCAGPIILRSTSPVLLTLFAILSGLACAALLHVYIAIRKTMAN